MSEVRNRDNKAVFGDTAMIIKVRKLFMSMAVTTDDGVKGPGIRYTATFMPNMLCGIYDNRYAGYMIYDISKL